METRHKSNEVLVERLLPHINENVEDRANAWEEWYVKVGVSSVLAFVHTKNDTSVPDADILQDAMVAAYEAVERGRYEPQRDIPFTAYVKGIARNKIREARRRTWRLRPMEDTPSYLLESDRATLERAVEWREQLTFLYDGIAKLPDSRRQVLQGYLAGRSTVEIADTLGLSEDAVRQHKCRGLRSLRKMHSRRF